MANGTRSSKRTSDDKSNSSKERQINGNRSTSSTAGSRDSPPIRRSQRQTTLQKSTPSPPSIRKSERLEKQGFRTPPAERKSERTETPKSSSPLRRSNRFKMLGSKISGMSSTLPDMRSKKKKSMMQLAMETEEVKRSAEQQSRSSSGGKWRMNARTYRAFLRRQIEGAEAKDASENLSTDKSYSINSNNHGSSDSHLVDVAVDCNERYWGDKEGDMTHQIFAETLESTPSTSAKPSSLKHICIEEKSGFVDENGSDGLQNKVEGNPQFQEVEQSTSNTGSHISEIDAELLPLKRKGCVDDDPDLEITSNDIHRTKADIIAVYPCPEKSENDSQTSRACSKRQRTDDTKEASPNTKLSPQLNCFSTVKQPEESQTAVTMKLTNFPSGVSHELYNNCEIINKLHQYKGRNAIMFDDQERIKKVISFIASFSNSNSQRFLIISTSVALHSWEKEFLLLAPFMNVVVYVGNKEIRQSIQKMLFDEGGHLIPQVLITSPEVVNEDLHLLNCTEWEVVTIDECQNPKVSSQLKQIKTLHMVMRLLVSSGQLKGGVTEYLNVLSLLEPHDDSNSSDNLPADSNETICDLKERLARYVVYECKDSSRFVEYWVPVHISNVQLEQYCATLLSNSLSLCSFSRSDPVGALREILMTTRKCCNHPYIVDGSLQMLLTKDRQEVEYLDIGIKASGKLQLLDAMIADLKNRCMKVLVLFQSLGSSGSLIGDILDDFVRQRFGPDSYERIDSGVIPSKKQSALSKFNKEKGRFVFLLEKRACLPSIKLSSVDAVILFDTDWNPINDIRSLQRITLNSAVEQIKLFRLYSSFTVEEKLLILARQEKHLDSNVQNISPNTSHTLLMWGTNYLFNKLDEFHSSANPTIDALEELHLKNVLQEFQRIFAENEEDNDSLQFSLISQVKQNQGTYTTNLRLLGEQKIQVMNEDLPYIFWIKLLEARHPQWRFSSGSTPRNRKRVQHFGESQKPEVENAEAVKKRKKVVNDKVDTDHQKTGWQGGRSSNRDTGLIECDERQKMYDSQTCLHVRLKPELAELCEVFRLPEDVKIMVERLLEYFIQNHHINTEPETVLQAFQISLCWTAASLLKHKMDHKESLICAREHLKFSCTKEEVDYVYSMLRCLRGIFVYRTKQSKVPDFSQSTELSSKDAATNNSLLASNLQNVQVDAGGFLGAQVADAKNGSSSGAMLEFQLVQRYLSTSIKDIQRKCDKKMAKLLQRQRLEKEDFNRKYEEEKAQLEKARKADAAVLINIYGNGASVTSDKLKKSESEYAVRFDELNQKMEARLRDLDAIHLAGRNEIHERKAFWVEALKSFVEVELVNQSQNQVHLSEGSNSLEPGHSMSVGEARSSDVPPIAPEKEVSIGSVIRTVEPNAENVPVCSSCDHEPAVSEFCFKQQIPAEFMPAGEAQLEGSAPVSCGDVQGDVLSVRHSPEDQICCESSIQVAERVSEIVHSNDGPDNLDTITPCLSDRGITDGAAVSNMDGDGGASLGMPETVGLKGSTSLIREECDGEAALSLPDGCAPGKVAEIVISRNDNRTVPDSVSLKEGHEIVSTLPREGRTGEAALSLSDGYAPARASVAVISRGNLQNALSVNPPCEEQFADAVASCSPSGQVPSVATESARGEVSERVDANQNGQSAGEVGQLRGIGGGMGEGSHSGEQSAEGLQQEQYTSVSALESQSPLDQVLGSQPSTSSEAQSEDASNREASMRVQVPEPSESHAADMVPSQSNQQAPVIELVEEMQDLISGESPLRLTCDSLSSTEHLLSSEVQIPNLSSECRGQPLANSAVPSPAEPPLGVPAGHILGTRAIPVSHGSSNHAQQTPDAVSSRASAPMNRDPLQTEMERICKEMDHIAKAYEETKLHLKSDLDKEIEEVLAQIRAKYEAKFKEKEAEYLHRKKELDSNFYQVTMNRLLAEAFRFKCMDNKASGLVGLTKEVRLMQQLVQPSALQNVPRPSIAPSLQLAAASMPQAIAPNQSSILSSGTTNRPPSISSFPSSGNLPVGSEIRAPAPHLQAFRSSAPVPANSSSPRPYVMPSQAVHTSPPAPLPSLPRPSSMPLHHAVPSNASQPGGAHLPQSGTNFILDMSTRSATTFNPTSCLPTEPGSNLLRPTQQQSVAPSTRQTNPNPTQASEAADIVCISDDD